MATESQVLANRLNAQKSTGPRTVEGKEIASQNAVTHGLLAQKNVIVGEDVGEFEFYRDQMLGELAPAGAMESMLAERAVGLSWRLRRAERVQNEAFDALLTKDSTSPLAKLTQSLRSRSDSGGAEDDLALGRVVVKDFGNARVLDRLLMYERRIEHSLYRTMTELQKLRLMRELEPALEKPTRPGECWGEPQPTCARDHAARQTKPMGTDVTGPVCGEAVGGGAKRSQSAEARLLSPLSREQACGISGSDSRGRGRDCVKRTQSAPARRGDERQNEPIVAVG